MKQVFWAKFELWPEPSQQTKDFIFWSKLKAWPQKYNIISSKMHQKVIIWCCASKIIKSHCKNPEKNGLLVQKFHFWEIFKKISPLNKKSIFFKKGDFWDLTEGGLAFILIPLTNPHQPYLWDIPILTILVQGRCVEFKKIPSVSIYIKVEGSQRTVDIYIN